MNCYVKMKTNKKSNNKQENELSKISPLIQSVGYTPDSNMCGDRPDICLPSFENKEIGIEVTDYAERTYLKTVGRKKKKTRGNLQIKAQKDFKKILDSYAKYFDQRQKDRRYYPKDSGYRITIWLVGGFFPYQENLATSQKIIFQELDNFLFPKNSVIDNQFICDVRCEPILNSQSSIVDYQRGYLDCMTPINDGVISMIIEEKEEKLREYKELAGNKSIREYWLVICLPSRISSYLSDYQMPSQAHTTYDRIYLVQDIMVWQIK